MSFHPLRYLIEGERMRYEPRSMSYALHEDPTKFEYPMILRTGCMASEMLGEQLIQLSAQGGAWHYVPWRMLRNCFLRYGLFKRVLMSTRARHPKLEPYDATRVPRSGRIDGRDRATMLLGLAHLFSKDLAIRLEVPGEGDYLAPTRHLLACAVTPGELLLSRPAHVFPADRPAPKSSLVR